MYIYSECSKVSMHSASFVASQVRESDIVEELLVLLSARITRLGAGCRSCNGVVRSYYASYVDINVIRHTVVVSQCIGFSEVAGRAYLCLGLLSLSVLHRRLYYICILTCG